VAVVGVEREEGSEGGAGVGVGAGVPEGEGYAGLWGG
jgi:hypothetical protein